MYFAILNDHSTFTCIRSYVPAYLRMEKCHILMRPCYWKIKQQNLPRIYFNEPNPDV